MPNAEFGIRINTETLGNVEKRTIGSRQSNYSRLVLAVLGIVGTVLALSCRNQTPPPTATKPAIPERIVTIAPDATEMIGALGAADRLVAVSDFCVWPPQIETLPRIGGLFDPNLERILRLRPDLIILRGHNRSIEELCRTNGITLFRDETESFDDIYKTLATLGDLLDCRAEADAVTDQMRRRVEAVRRAVADRPRPRVFMTLARDPESLASIMTGSRGTFVDEMITLAGGQNVFADLGMDYPTVSIEAILVARPEVIVDAMPEAPESPALAEKVRRQWTELGPTPAAESGRIFVLTDENCYIPSPRIVDVIAKLARLFHPDAIIPSPPNSDSADDDRVAGDPEN